MAERITAERVGGAYSNYLKIGQNAFEFLFDFGQLYLEEGEAQFHTRIVTTPAYAKAFLKVLGDCIARYEQNFGSIPEELIELEMPEKWWIT